ncbi:hypothetical protein BDI4_580013 [Burkholderia diffusa]|nr:hypothetical protein BDI4_580013 [Burkholderia diffusa]
MTYRVAGRYSAVAQYHIGRLHACFEIVPEFTALYSTVIPQAVERRSTLMPVRRSTLRPDRL